MTSYWLSSNERKINGTKADYISLCFIFMCTTLFTFICFSLTSLTNVDTLNMAISIFNAAPVVLPLTWIISRMIMPNMRLEPGSSYVQQKIYLYYFVAGLTTMFYFTGLRDFSLKGFPMNELYSLFGAILNRHTVSVSLQPAIFLLIETISLSTSVFFFDFIENGGKISSSIKYIFLSILLSPGTAFLLSVINRESAKPPLKKI